MLILTEVWCETYILPGIGASLPANLYKKGQS